MPTTDTTLKLALPKGRMQKAIFELFAEAGMGIRNGPRAYRPWLPMDNAEAKILKHQNVVKMLHEGLRDLGFAGADWVDELDAELVELLDTGLDPVRLVAAAPEAFVAQAWPPKGPIVIASEYEQITRRWVAAQGIEARFVHSYGATEVFPPEDADAIVDNTATGSTLRANNLVIVDELMRSSTRLYANPRALDDPAKRGRIDDLVLLLSSVLEARKRVMLEVNVGAERVDALVELLPCMRAPTIATLHGGDSFAIKVAVPRGQVATLIPEIRAAGGTDIVVTQPTQIIA